MHRFGSNASSCSNHDMAGGVIYESLLLLCNTFKMPINFCLIIHPKVYWTQWAVVSTIHHFSHLNIRTLDFEEHLKSADFVHHENTSDVNNIIHKYICIWRLILNTLWVMLHLPFIILFWGSQSYPHLRAGGAVAQRGCTPPGYMVLQWSHRGWNSDSWLRASALNNYVLQCLVTVPP